MINYLELISTYYPAAICETYSTVDNYDAIVWKTTAIPKAELDGYHITNLKSKKITNLSVQTENLITEGFLSSALGSAHYYDSALEDQINLIGVVAAGTDSYYACREGSLTGYKSYKLHTISQLKQVIEDGKMRKLMLLQNFAIKRAMVEQATTESEIDNITL